ncbi:MAG: hypothetical protein KDA27_06210 [Candidatus Eisenbacteria bacterium]|uniref:Right handed beta helix domain-containing protein n=1 Tax=Eiseniibacteriota bacterium TaxID=2212470 RepID=A0A956SCE2_UNCEI|nr:hypothetical protein [Candidatus Eisenbacteria bacterium]
MRASLRRSALELCVFPFLLCGVVSLNGSVLAADLIVDGSGGGDFEFIQDAIGAAVDGDRVLVRSGTYEENVDFVGKDIVVESESGANSTIIDGTDSGSVVTFQGGEPSSAVLRGFTLTGGSGTFYESNIRGGAVFCLQSSPTIEDCAFVENMADYAAGMYVDTCSPVVRGCSFLRNESLTYGGGIAGPDALIEIYDCYFEENRAIAGDGVLHLALASPIEDCVFVNNRSRAGGAINSGGAGADFSIRRCQFFGNEATDLHGGAIRVHEATCLIEECLFVDNFAALDGGAIMCIDGGSSLIQRCTFDRNGAGRFGGTVAAWNGARPGLDNSIVSGSTGGGGLYCSDASIEVVCSDVWENVGGNYTGGCPDMTGTDGNVSEDPRWCAPDAGDYGLFNSSPCAPANSGGCDQIGAFGVECTDPSPVVHRSWGGIKAAYR